MSRSKQPDNPAIAILWRSITHLVALKKEALRRQDAEDYTVIDSSITELLHCKRACWDEMESLRHSKSQERMRQCLLKRKAA